MKKVNVITVEVLKKVILSENPILIEALPKKYFDQGHLPNAINIPLESSEIEITNALLDKSKTCITYCTGLTCPNSKKLAERLTQLGYINVFAFEEGKEGWVLSGSKLQRNR